MTLHIVPEEVAPVFISQFFIVQQRKHEVLWCSKWAVLSHARDTHTKTVLDEYGAVLLPAAAAELVLTGQREEVFLPHKLHTHCAVVRGVGRGHLEGGTGT